MLCGHVAADVAWTKRGGIAMWQHMDMSCGACVCVCACVCARVCAYASVCVRTCVQVSLERLSILFRITLSLYKAHTLYTL